MGRDIAGEREMRRTHGRRVSGLEALVVEGEQRRLLLLPPFALRRSSERRSASHPAVFPSTFRFHGPHRVWIRFRGFLPLPVPPTADWIIWTAAAAAAAGQTITRTTDEANLFIRIGYKNILVNLDDAPKVERTYRSGDLHHERAQRATYSSETLENGSG